MFFNATRPFIQPSTSNAFQFLPGIRCSSTRGPLGMICNRGNGSFNSFQELDVLQLGHDRKISDYLKSVSIPSRNQMFFNVVCLPIEVVAAGEPFQFLPGIRCSSTKHQLHWNITNGQRVSIPSRNQMFFNTSLFFWIIDQSGAGFNSFQELDVLQRSREPLMACRVQAGFNSFQELDVLQPFANHDHAACADQEFQFLPGIRCSSTC